MSHTTITTIIYVRAYTNQMQILRQIHTADKNMIKKILLNKSMYKNTHLQTSKYY